MRHPQKTSIVHFDRLKRCQIDMRLLSTCPNIKAPSTLEQEIHIQASFTPINSL